MRRILISLATLLALATTTVAQDKPTPISIESFRHAGPYVVGTPYKIDTVNISGSAYKQEDILDGNLSFSVLEGASSVSAIPGAAGEAIHLLGFSLQNSIYAKASVKVEGLDKYRLYVDGKSASSEQQLKLEPGTHDIVIKCLAGTAGNDSLKVSVSPEKEGRIAVRTDGRNILSLDRNTDGLSCGALSISASGKYILICHKMTANGGKASYWYELRRASDGKVIARPTGYLSWMPSSDRYYYTHPSTKGNDLYVCDPESGEETLLCKDLPDGSYSFSPTEDFLIYQMTQDGPKEGDVHQVLTPDDRQPGWRDRSYISIFDIATGVMQPLTFGWHNSWLCDISSDGKKILFETQRERLAQRPTQLYSVYEMDLATREVKCLIEDDGFISSASYSPDGKQLLVIGTAEAFKGIGKNVKEGQTPNNYDYQLFTLNIADGKVNPLTKKFNPSISNATWCKADGKIYATTEDKDTHNIYRFDPKSGKSEWMKDKEEYLYNYDIATSSPVLVYYGQSLENGDRAYAMDLKTGKQTLLHDFSAERFYSTELGKGDAYEFKSSRGDLINGFYVLPPDFDPSKKYPLLVHYYGGCSPTARYCTGAYSPQMYAAMGFVFYVINPSGAAGFGQEFAARHVNTAGDVVSDDIIEGTLAFCKDHPYIDAEKIGCFSASYGGFMTQLLLSKTDIYATGISHAGISDHTSYWGEGYWGYSYSETSMANNYPWTNKDLYVDHSTLFNADKIHTPLLFLHGSADTNVPIGESIQMFTALKILGEDTAFVVVDGEDHGVYDYTKRRQWLRTIFAWFEKYLQDDDTWWNELYPSKNL